MAGRNEAAWTYNYLDLQKLTGKELNTIQAAASRGRSGKDSGFVPDDFESVVRWVFRNATDEFRFELLQEMRFFRTEKGLARLRHHKPNRPQIQQ